VVPIANIQEILCAPTRTMTVTTLVIATMLLASVFVILTIMDPIVISLELLDNLVPLVCVKTVELVEQKARSVFASENGPEITVKSKPMDFDAKVPIPTAITTVIVISQLDIAFAIRDTMV